MLADDRLVAIGELAHEVVGACEPGRAQHRVHPGFRIGERDVGAHAVGEEERVFEHQADRAADLAQARLTHVGAVDADPARVDVVEPGNEPGDRRLARRGRAHERDRLPTGDHEVEPVEHDPVRAVAEGHVLEAHLTRTVGQRACVRDVFDRGIGDQHVVDAAGRRRRPGQLREEHADHPQRPDQHQDVEVGGDDRADGEVAVEHLMTAVPEDPDEPDGGQQVDLRHEVGAQAGLLDRVVVDAVGLAAQPLPLQPFGAETLDDTHAGDALLDHARQVGELLLLRAARAGTCGG